MPIKLAYRLTPWNPHDALKISTLICSESDFVLGVPTRVIETGAK